MSSEVEIVWVVDLWSGASNRLDGSDSRTPRAAIRKEMQDYHDASSAM